MKKKQSVIILIAVTLVMAGLTGASPLQQKIMPAEANWVLHVNMEQFKDSQLGGLIVDELVSKGLDDKMSAFEKLTGWNPLYDLKDITICGPDQNKKNAVVILNGNFDKDKIIAALDKVKSHKQRTVGRITIHQWFDKQHGIVQYGAFIRNNIIVIASNPKVIIKEIAVIAKKARNITSTDKLLALQEIPEGTFILAAGDGISEMLADKAKAAVMRNAKQASLFIGENNDNFFARCNLIFANEQYAINIERIINGIVAFASLHQDKIPVACDIANAVKVERIAGEVKVKFDYPSDKVFACMKAIAAHKKMIKNKIHNRRQSRKVAPKRGNPNRGNSEN